ncbi:IPT/TIG domain-containing protein [Flavivirga eckloniae]|uniref:IPT/TIG domain-containing protein n=1 Tax=Flavivirga eckloniae TaxID=1803846 RepID=A0A2K9PPW1_9FLAO|nr:IPT/TIG domain-containing protein [Flavivirga eckloniae]AUP79113.1 hypothetical protein C1H87_10545 [Flavivirga eckloniae]
MKNIKKHIKKVLPIGMFLATCIGIVVLSCDNPDYEALNRVPAIEQLTINSINPSTGDIGTLVEVKGTNFSVSPANNKVSINDLAVTVTEASDSILTIKIPEGATSGNIVISHGSFTANGPAFSVVDIPTISDVDPSRAAIGDVITITGTKFSTTLSDNIVVINGLPAIVTDATETSITTTVPEGSVVGFGDVTVTVAGQLATSSGFIVEPAITELNPLMGVIGTEVTITGTSFGSTIADNIVTFTGSSGEAIPAVVTAATETSITTSVPQGAFTGPISITVNNVTITSDEFVIDQAPVTIIMEISIEEDNVESIDGEMDLDSGDLELGELSSSSHDSAPIIGLRFANLEVPQGAVISNATIQFTADTNSDANPVELTIYCESTDDAAPYTETLFNLTDRGRTTASVVWTITEEWTRDDRGPSQQTVDLSSVIQEIIDRPNWVSGNSLNIIMVPTGVSATVTSTSIGREAEGFTTSTPGDTPELTLTYDQ